MTEKRKRKIMDMGKKTSKENLSKKAGGSLSNKKKKQRKRN